LHRVLKSVHHAAVYRARISGDRARSFALRANVNNGHLPYEHVYAGGFERPGDRFPAGDNRKFLPGRERKPRIRGGRWRRRRRGAVVAGLIARFRGGQFAQFATHVAVSPRESPGETPSRVADDTKPREEGGFGSPARESPNAGDRAAALCARFRYHFRFPPLPSGFTAAHRRESEIALHYEKDTRVCVHTHARTHARAHTAHIDPYTHPYPSPSSDEASVRVEDRGPSGVVAGSIVDRRAKRANRLSDSFFGRCPRMRLRATLNTMHVVAIRSPGRATACRSSLSSYRSLRRDRRLLITERPIQVHPGARRIHDLSPARDATRS